MQRKTTFDEEEFYHVYNRGVDKRMIFLRTVDYRRFMSLLYLSNSDENIRTDNIFRSKTFEDILKIELGDPLVAIGAFCLMPNHFHLLLTPLSKGGISRFMLKLQTGYSMYFNVKNSRSGSLFEGPFKGVHVSNDRYLKYLFSYIHLNPSALQDRKRRETSCVENYLTRFIKEYPYSSLSEYLNGLHTITDPDRFPRYFSSQDELKRHITDWLKLE